jgi:CRISPR/Cas system-associated exonuclease Cas4 (RecB family)
MGLSKSRFIAGLQCLKRLYLEVHQPELAPELDERSMAVFEQGHEVGRWAQKMFPGGVLIEAGHEEMGKALRQTEQAVAAKQHRAIFEAAFTHANVLARIDILERLPRNQWRLIEVKSSTSLKDYYLYDVAVQRFVLEGLGMTVVPCLLHLNREYVYDGKQYELEKLFVIRDVTDETAALEQEVRDLLREEWKVLARAKPPDIEPGSHCTKPYGCEFYDVCNTSLPIDHVANLPGISPKKLEELASQGIESIGKIPKDFSLTDRQRRAWECAKTGKPWFGKGLKLSLAGLRYPLYFMDFETLAAALPRYAGMSPYGQIPFQWSLHIQRTPGAEPEHFEFLADRSSDPRPEFVKALCQVIGKKGSVVAYNSRFESGCLRSLAEEMPQHKDEVGNIQDRLWDLLPVMRAHVYDLAFRGSYSLKSVLPALVPHMSYDGMEVAEGSDAGLAWEKMLLAEVGSEERKRLKGALLAYCKQDTLAMVRLLEVLAAA